MVILVIRVVDVSMELIWLNFVGVLISVMMSMYFILWESFMDCFSC